jgi:hypothetical protein
MGINWQTRYSNYDEAVYKFYYALSMLLEKSVLNSENPIDAAKDFTLFYRIILWGGGFKDDKLKEILASFSFKGYDIKKVHGYAHELFKGNEEMILSGHDGKSDLRLLCFTKAVIFCLNKADIIIQHLNVNGGNVDNLKKEFIVLPESVPVLDAIIVKYGDTYYNRLVAGFHKFELNVVSSPIDSDITTFIKTEIAEFSRLLNTEENTGTWKYLQKRLDAESLTEIQAIHTAFIEIPLNYLDVISSLAHSKQLRYGKIMGIKKYLEFLKKKLAIDNNKAFINLYGALYGYTAKKKKLFELLKKEGYIVGGTEADLFGIFDGSFKNKLTWRKLKREYKKKEIGGYSELIFLLLLLFLLTYSDPNHFAGSRIKPKLISDLANKYFQFEGQKELRGSIVPIKSRCCSYIKGNMKEEEATSDKVPASHLSLIDIVKKAFDISFAIPLKK